MDDCSIISVSDYNVERSKFLDTLATFKAEEEEDDDESDAQHDEDYELKTDVLRFDREKVLNNVLKALDKAKAPHRRQ